MRLLSERFQKPGDFPVMFSLPSPLAFFASAVQLKKAALTTAGIFALFGWIFGRDCFGAGGADVDRLGL
jgi:hypothetical protein